jgi:hypothetical protein
MAGEKTAVERQAAALAEVRRLLAELAAAVELRYGGEASPEAAGGETRALVDLAAQLAALVAGPGLNDGG